MEEAELIRKRIAYLRQVQALYRRERIIGFVMILAGFLLVLPAQWAAAWPHPLIWTGYALVAVGWTFFVYVIARRTAWRRANPFNPNA
jgi:phosphatidylglycerophosphate synthase